MPEIVRIFILSAILYIFYCVLVAIKNKIRNRPMIYDAPDVELMRADSMTGQQFEFYCMKLLCDSGMFPGARLNLTKTTGDFGVDILITMPDNSRCVVQCKRYSKNVGVKPVQEIYAGMSYYGAQKAMVMTNSWFTESAAKLARSTGVILCGRRTMKSIIEQIRKQEVQRKRRERKERRRQKRKERKERSEQHEL